MCEANPRGQSKRQGPLRGGGPGPKSLIGPFPEPWGTRGSCLRKGLLGARGHDRSTSIPTSALPDLAASYRALSRVVVFFFRLSSK